MTWSEFGDDPPAVLWTFSTWGLKPSKDLYLWSKLRWLSTCLGETPGQDTFSRSPHITAGFQEKCRRRTEWPLMALSWPSLGSQSISPSWLSGYRTKEEVGTTMREASRCSGDTVICYLATQGFHSLPCGFGVLISALKSSYILQFSFLSVWGLT